MKFTSSWLQEHIKVDISGKKLANILTNLGLEVESCKNLNDYFNKMYVCEIINIEKHPNADRLNLCTISIGKKTSIAVCGANNVKIGLKTIFAPNGAYIPGRDFILEKKNIRGVTGDGMLCSEEELSISDNSDGIIELDSKYKIGDKFSFYLKDEFLYQIGLTPNRGDCASIRGIARDLGAKINKRLFSEDIDVGKGSFKSKIKWDLSLLDKKEDCPKIIGRYFYIKKNIMSPYWLKKKLLSIGMSHISSLVDITNFILYDLGRPLHVFDAAKIVGNLKVRRAKDKESFIGLDKKKYELTNKDLVIADKDKVVSLAGIMGGLNSCVDENTKEVFLEVALFDPNLISNTGRRLNIISDSRYRFERGIDPKGLIEGLEKATKMIIDICGGEFSEIEKEGKISFKDNKIKYNPTNFLSVVGYEISVNKQLEILKSLSFQVEKNKKNQILLIPPSWRSDIHQENDIIEEIARIEGYEKIPYEEQGQNTQHNPDAFSNIKKLSLDYRDKLANTGLIELVTFSFISERKVFPKSDLKDELILSNPISRELAVMRNSLFPNLLDAAVKNFSNGAETINFFEIGSIFLGTDYKDQKTSLAIIKGGYESKKSWIKTRRIFDFFDIKEDLLQLINILGIESKVSLERSKSDWLHPGKSADIIKDKVKLGSFGELHPSLKKKIQSKTNYFNR